jgi:hypothetical protein
MMCQYFDRFANKDAKHFLGLYNPKEGEGENPEYQIVNHRECS